MPKTKGLSNYSNPNSFGSKMRSKRMRFLKPLIEHEFNKKGGVSMLGVGGRKTCWNLLGNDDLASRNASLTISSLPSDHNGEDDAISHHVIGDACDLSQYADNHFNLTNSNSVIEHVGIWNNVKKFASDASRVGKSL